MESFHHPGSGDWRCSGLSVAQKLYGGGEVRAALDWLKAHSTQSTLDDMARYAIPSDKAYGVAMKDIKTQLTPARSSFGR